ncbi:MAG TPA: putative lipid II flippase FtsW [Anaeromyxobacteraceae bacterium]|nr:putative lipid II flippase FtsW [Anaeromyxobacteraceae bacterium]
MSRRDGTPHALPAFDGLLLGAVLGLTALGAVMVYSASAVVAAERLGNQFHFLTRQLLAAGLGIALLFAALRLGTQRIALLAYPLLAATVVLMVLVSIPGLGRQAGGAQRWLDLGFFRFQPSEAAKVVLILYLARSLARKRDKVRMFSIGVLPHLLVTGLLVVLCLAQRDLGSGVILFLVLFAMLFAAGAKVSILVAAVIGALPVAWHVVKTTPWRYARILAWLDPEAHRHGVGYQLWESLVGSASGGWLGQGLGEGKGKLFYLPAAPTDFIAAVIAEETGLAGVLLLLSLYAVVVWRGMRAALNASDAFGCYAAVGITTLVGAQAVVNLAVVFGLLPTKGLTLPFVSYGGSSLLTLLAAAGVLLSVSGDRGGFLRRGVQAVRVAPPDAAEVAP